MSVSPYSRNWKADCHADCSNPNSEDRKETPPICKPTRPNSTTGNVRDDK